MVIFSGSLLQALKLGAAAGLSNYGLAHPASNIAAISRRIHGKPRPNTMVLAGPSSPVLGELSQTPGC